MHLKLATDVITSRYLLYCHEFVIKTIGLKMCSCWVVLLLTLMTKSKKTCRENTIIVDYWILQNANPFLPLIPYNANTYMYVILILAKSTSLEIWDTTVWCSCSSDCVNIVCSSASLPSIKRISLPTDNPTGNWCVAVVGVIPYT